MTNKRTRFKVVVAQTQREQVTEVQQTHHSVEEDRKLYLQVCEVSCLIMDEGGQTLEEQTCKTFDVIDPLKLHRAVKH